MMRSFKIMLIAGVIGGVSLLSLNCTAAARAAPQYQTAAVQRGNLTVDITGVGNLALSQKTDLAFEIAGTVTEVLVEEGDTVEKGQVLAKLDTSDWETQLSALEDKVTAAERQLTTKQRAVTTAERQLTTKKDAVTAAERLLATKKDAVTAAERLLATKKDAVTTAERLLATKKRNVTAKERDVVAKERDVAEAELDLKDAQTALDTTQITYTDADYVAAQAAVDAAQTELDKAVLVLAKYEPETDGYNIKRNLVVSAQSKLKSAQDKLEAMSSAFEDELASNQKAVETAQWNLETAQVAVEDAQIAVEDAQVAVEDAQKAIETAQIAVEDAQKAIETAQFAVEDAQKAIVTAQLAVEDARQDIEDAQLAVKDAQKALADARKALAEAQKDHPEIIAPAAGFITSVNVKGGDEVKKGTIAMTLADPDKFEADILVNETDIMRTKLGGNASVQVEAMSGMSLPAKITHIAPTATIQSGVVNYKVKVELESLPSVPPAQQSASNDLSSANVTSPRLPTGGTPFSGNVTAGQFAQRFRQAASSGNFTQQQMQAIMSQRQGGTRAASGQVPMTLPADFQLREGQTVTVSILVAEKSDVLLVPNGAITRRGTGSVVKVLKDGVFEERSITTGISNWQYTEVSGGLSEGETVVIPQTTTTTPTASQQGRQGGIMVPGPGMGGFGR